MHKIEHVHYNKMSFNILQWNEQDVYNDDYGDPEISQYQNLDEGFEMQDTMWPFRLSNGI